ncbi:MAG: hypothetical protein HC822_27135 [Oscillochloris sp.]|nr:hypothetical protein [Oscillochloris sp.]
MVAGQEVPPALEQPAWGWVDVGLTVMFAALVTIALIFVSGLIVANNPEANTSLISPVVYVAGLGVYLSIAVGVYLFAVRRAGWAALGMRSVPNIELLLVPVFFWPECAP